MKQFLIILFVLLSAKLWAQQKSFPLDDNGKYIYYKVVDSQSVNRDSLMLRARGFITKNKQYISTENASDTAITAKGKTIIDKTVLVASHPSGEVKYSFNFEVRPGKYRYWFSNFEFIPYQRDRYGNYVATKNIGTPLERSPSKLAAAEWKAILASAYTKIDKIAADFQKSLATERKPQARKKEEKISVKKW
ncbi:DUF4468 domain-containing protein [Pedobacter sp.]|uniref:DUF4468 domain-containing protein n=1 Tax=Pedobacter sp. TaxID=1411316 RepID=UPI003BA8ECD8